MTHAYLNSDSRDYKQSALCYYPAPKNLIEVTREAFANYYPNKKVPKNQVPDNKLNKGLDAAIVDDAEVKIVYWKDPPRPDKTLFPVIVQLLEELEDLAFRLEIDVNFCGDSHKFNNEKYRATAPYRDSEFDLGGILGSPRLRDLQIKFYKLLPHLPKGAVEKFDMFLLFTLQGFVQFMN